jgi:hypothetical protein
LTAGRRGTLEEQKGAESAAAEQNAPLCRREREAGGEDGEQQPQGVHAHCAAGSGGEKTKNKIRFFRLLSACRSAGACLCVWHKTRAAPPFLPFIPTTARPTKKKAR